MKITAISRAPFAPYIWILSHSTITTTWDVRKYPVKSVKKQSLHENAQYKGNYLNIIKFEFLL